MPVVTCKACGRKQTQIVGYFTENEPPRKGIIECEFCAAEIGTIKQLPSKEKTSETK